MGAARCNALEEPQSGIDVADGFVAITLRPFELVTSASPTDPTRRVCELSTYDVRQFQTR